MALADDIQAKLDILNTPQQVQGRSGTVWGYDPAKKAWYTVAATGPQRGQKSYQNTTMGIPASVGDRNVSADGNVIEPGDVGGGVLHGNAKWSNDNAGFYSPFSWDKLATYATLGALTGGVANAVTSGAAAGGGLSTGAVVAPQTTMASALAGGAVPGATGAVVGGTGAGMAFGLDDLFTYVLPTAGSLIDTVVQSKANNAANAAYQKQVDEALADARKQRDIDTAREDARIAEERRRRDEDLGIGREQEAYKRALTDQDIRTRAEQEAYTRSLLEAGRITAAEKESYDRAEAQRRMEVANEIEGYSRAKYAEAETYGRNRYANVVETLEPYRAAGVTATGRLSQLLGQPIPAYTGATYYDLAREARKPVDLPGAPSVPALRQIPIAIPKIAGSGGPPIQPLNQGPGPLPPPQTQTSTSAPQLAVDARPGATDTRAQVLMQSPIGDQRYVSPDEVEGYLARGARVVGA